MEVNQEDRNVAASIRHYFPTAKSIRKTGTQEYTFVLPQSSKPDDSGIEMVLFCDPTSQYGLWQCHIVGSKFPMVSGNRVVNVLKKIGDIATILDRNISQYRVQAKALRSALAYSSPTDVSAASTPGLDDQEPIPAKGKRSRKQA